MRAVICPVCNGKGVLYGIAESGAYPTQSCHGCGGLGWVAIREDKPITDLGYELTGLDFGIGWNNKCPACDGDRNFPGETGCPMGSHYGSYCSV